MKKVIQVDKIDQAKVDEIKSAHDDLSKSKDKDKILHLDLTDTTGNTELASKAAEILHSDPNVIPETEASGAQRVYRNQFQDNTIYFDGNYYTSDK